jgi:hypothetical protein
MVGASKDTIQAAMKELTERVGDAVGRRRESFRIHLPGLGSLNFSSGGAKFTFEGSLAPKRPTVNVGHATSTPAPPSLTDTTVSSRLTSALHTAGKLTVRTECKVGVVKL